MRCAHRSSRGLPRWRAIDQTGPAVEVELHQPVADDLQRDTADCTSGAPAGALVDRSQGKHWRGDPILRKKKLTSLGILVEQVTRYTLLIARDAKDADTVRGAYTEILGKMPPALKGSLTYDQVKEMTGHKAFGLQTESRYILLILRHFWNLAPTKTSTADAAILSKRHGIAC